MGHRDLERLQLLDIGHWGALNTVQLQRSQISMSVFAFGPFFWHRVKHQGWAGAGAGGAPPGSPIPSSLSLSATWEWELGSGERLSSHLPQPPMHREPPAVSAAPPCIREGE